MSNRFKYYGLLTLVICTASIYLLFLSTYNWHLGEFHTFSQAVEDMISRNSRWLTWAACAGGFGLLLGLMSAISLLLANSTKEFFDDMSENLQSIVKKSFPKFRYIGVFFVLMFVIFLSINQDWRFGLRSGLEFVGVVIWVVLIITSFILVSTLLVDLFIKGLFDLIIKRLYEEND